MLNLSRYFNFFITKIYMGFIEIKEYKVNTLIILLNDIIYMYITFIFINLFSNLTSYFDTWSNFDKFTYLILLYSGVRIMRYFLLRRFSQKLKSGELNLYLTRPLNPFIFAATNGINSVTVFSTFPVIISFIYIIIVGSYQNILLTILLHIFGIFYFALILNVCMSFAFFMKEFFLGRFITDDLVPLSEKFTPASFSGNNILEMLFYLLPTSFYGYLCIELLKGNFIVLDYMFYGFLVFTILLVLLIIMWKFGLKRYEAFG
ncbi:MAG: ABC-2 family transporter protein [Nanoarchaeales archaeon]|nr:ABC-2 family transporter protein [Nanoarchaeales archaeon]